MQGRLVVEGKQVTVLPEVIQGTGSFSIVSFLPSI